MTSLFNWPIMNYRCYSIDMFKKCYIKPGSQGPLPQVKERALLTSCVFYEMIEMFALGRFPFNRKFPVRNSLRSWRDSWAGEWRRSRHIPRGRSPQGISRAAKPRVKFNLTLHQSSHGFATRVHGFATKRKALAREIPPATQANEKQEKHTSLKEATYKVDFYCRVILRAYGRKL